MNKPIEKKMQENNVNVHNLNGLNIKYDLFRL